MKVIWSPEAQADVRRLYLFLAQHDLQAADVLFDHLVDSPERLLDFPRRGPRLSQFETREVREFRVGAYLLRYELMGPDIHVLRFFHARENRFE
jgi:plasmid stabilization system protein ParE